MPRMCCQMILKLDSPRTNLSYPQIDRLYRVHRPTVRGIESSGSQIDLLDPFSTLLPSNENVQNKVIPGLPDLFLMLKRTAEFVHLAPQYLPQQGWEVAWKTILCNHSGSPDEYLDIYASHAQSCFRYTQFFFDLDYRREYVRSALLH